MCSQISIQMEIMKLKTDIDFLQISLNTFFLADSREDVHIAGCTGKSRSWIPNYFESRMAYYSLEFLSFSVVNYVCDVLAVLSATKCSW